MTRSLRETVVRLAGLPGRALRKLLFDRLKYLRGDDYDARRYWHDRFRKHGMSLRAAGHEGLSEGQNAREYELAGRQLLELCRANCPGFPDVRAAEIGVGTGFYTGLLHQAGVQRYVGLDITDVFFERLRPAYPDYEFLCRDVTRDPIGGPYELILMIDVVEHIVKEDKFRAAMANVKAALADGGVFLIAGLSRRRGRRLFYLRGWTEQDLRQEFPGWDVGRLQEFRDTLLTLIRRGAPEAGRSGRPAPEDASPL